MTRRSAFSLTELVVVLAITAILITCSTVAFFKSTVSIEDGAEDAALWLMERTSRAQFEESSFRLVISKVSSRGNNMKMEITWLNGRNKNMKETYANNDVFMYDTASISARTYDGVWQTMTPALSIGVRALSDSGKRKYVKVSGSGLVSVSDTQ